MQGSFLDWDPMDAEGVEQDDMVAMGSNLGEGLGDDDDAALDEYIEEELRRYLDKRQAQRTQRIGPLMWWATEGAAFPLMQKAAPDFLCVPASSASSERSFSKTGAILRPRRLRLGPDMVRYLPYLGED